MTHKLEAGIEIAPEMIEAGLDTLYCFDIREPEDEMRNAVAAVFRAMAAAGVIVGAAPPGSGSV